MPVTQLSISEIDNAFSCLKLQRWMLLLIKSVLPGIALASLASAAQQESRESEAAGGHVLMTHVGPPSEVALDEFKKAGTETSDHTP